MSAHDWFEQLFGFRETNYAEAKSNFRLSGTELSSLVNGRVFQVGTFSTPTLGELRERSRGGAAGPLEVKHEVVGDVLEIHSSPDNRAAMFQVASQFNCLEFADPHQVPESGITQYAFDPTQGPACALAAAGASVVRNYFVPVGDQTGQTREKQLNNLDGLEAMLGERYWDIRNGYSWSDEARLAQLAEVLAHHERETLLGAVKIGLQRSVQVTFASRFVEPATPTSVSQAFCSALSCGYSGLSLDQWEPLATLVLDAAYEATLRAAAIDAADGTGSGRVWLTFIGGGVFANRPAWIAHAIGRTLSRAAADRLGLDVRIAHYRSLDNGMKRAINEARLGG